MLLCTILHKIPFVNKKHYYPGGLPVVAAEGRYAKKFKMAEPSDYPCLSSSEDDEYSDPLELAASAGARLSTPEKPSISWKRKLQTNPAEKKRNVHGSVDPNVFAWDRVNAFKDQCLTTVSGNLRCDACRETLSKI